MNNALIKQLANKAGCDYLYDYSDDGHAIVCDLIDIEKFAESIVSECVKVAMMAVSDDEPKEAWYLIQKHFGVEK